jgi:hypothetical protein
MFSVEQKRQISNAVQNVLRNTGHPELPSGEIQFHLHVDGAESWSWADIKNNGAVTNPGVNPWNESQAETAAKQQSDEWNFANSHIRGADPNCRVCYPETGCEHDWHFNPKGSAHCPKCNRSESSKNRGTKHE